MAEEDLTEKDIREYFEEFRGWRVTKLDTGKKRAADFRVSDSNISFLCEVKTIESVRSDFSSTPLDYQLEQREKRRIEIEEWQKENPDKRLIMRSEDREFVFGDKREFVKKYQGRRRNTEAGFKKFAEGLKDYLKSSRVKHLPYSFRLDSDNLYQPTVQEQKDFFEWLENEILAIDEGKPSRYWVAEKPNYGSFVTYSAFYQIHKPTHENDVKIECQLTIRGPFEIDSLEISIHSYGTLNLGAITSNVESGLKQLESSASWEDDKELPRIIALAFESGIGLEWQLLSFHISWLLKEHPNLSAIAVLDWIPDGTPPSPKHNIRAWYEFMMTTPAVVRFIVYHNSWLQTVKPLPVNVFDDGRSIQLSPVEWS